LQVSIPVLSHSWLFLTCYIRMHYDWRMWISIKISQNIWYVKFCALKVHSKMKETKPKPNGSRKFIANLQYRLWRKFVNWFRLSYLQMDLREETRRGFANGNIEISEDYRFSDSKYICVMDDTVICGSEWKTTEDLFFAYKVLYILLGFIVTWYCY
jgi:hypothetical protein